MKALLLIDIQNDFLPGGALAVPDGDAVIPICNRLQNKFELVIATQDWHPQDHKSFAVNHRDKKEFETITWNGLPQVLWPVHCVQNTRGAEFHPDLIDDIHIRTISKGLGDEDCYSAFDGTDLALQLHRLGVEEIWVGGLATDYCVKSTVLEGLKEGFQVKVIEDAIRPVELQPGDGERALEEMRVAGAEIVPSSEFQVSSSQSAAAK